MNRRFCRSRIIAYIFLPLLFFYLALASPANAFPPIPVKYGGDAFLSADDSQPVVECTEITGWADGVMYGISTTSPDNHYSIMVSGDDPDTPIKEGCGNYEPIIFCIDEYVAMETGSFVSGGNTLVYLHVDVDNQPVWLKINEIKPTGSPEWVELYNPSHDVVYLDDYYLVNRRGIGLFYYFVLDGYSIGPLDYLVVELPGLPDFELDDAGDDLKLIWTDPNGSTASGFDVVIDNIEYGTITGNNEYGPIDSYMNNADWIGDPDSTLARMPDRTDTEDCSIDFAIDATPTPGFSNDITTWTDLVDFSKAYGAESGDANWNPNCDLNNDGKVDVSDLFDLSKNYGEEVEAENKVLVLVLNEVFQQLEQRLKRYASDISDFDLMIINGSWADPADVRLQIQEAYNNYNISGCILVGDIVAAYYRSENVHGTFIFPTDLYYMDVDGIWIDYGPDGIFDNRTDSNGVEIWVSRIKAPTNNVTLLQLYFDKNHAFYSETIGDYDNALAYIKDCEFGQAHRVEVLKKIYNETDIVFLCGANATKVDYLETLRRGFETVWISCHGGPTRQLIEEDPVVWFDGNDARMIENGSIFYLLHNCEVGRYDVVDYLAGWYVFGNNNGLIALASTTVWESIDHDFFIDANNNSYIGNAFLETIKHADELAKTDPIVARNLYFGAVLIGDSFIKIGQSQGEVASAGIYKAEVTVVPEIPSTTILPLVMLATLVVALFPKKEKAKSQMINFVNARALSLYLLGKYSLLELKDYDKEKNGGCRSGEDRVGTS